MAATGPLGPPLSPAEQAEADAVRSACLAAALKGDKVYVVTAAGRKPVVFGHESDAEAYAATTTYGHLFRLSVLDHADARRLIEQEEG